MIKFKSRIKVLIGSFFLLEENTGSCQTQGPNNLLVLSLFGICHELIKDRNTAATSHEKSNGHPRRLTSCGLVREQHVFQFLVDKSVFGAQRDQSEAHAASVDYYFVLVVLRRFYLFN